MPPKVHREPPGLRAFEILLDADPHLQSAQAILDPLSQTFLGSTALLLRHAGDHWQCIAASDQQLVGLRWLKGEFFEQVAAGRVCARSHSHELPEWSEVPHGAIAPGHPALYVPLRVQGQRGILVLLRPVTGEHFANAEISLARQLAVVAMAAVAACNARTMQAQLRELRGEMDRLRETESDLTRRAYTDELTSLPNRARIQQHVDDILRTGAARQFALAFIDLDNFKHINDYYNHAVGDALLVKLASRIARLVRESDMLARISGDEFLLLINPIRDGNHVRAVVQELLDNLKQPFQVEGFEMFTSASIGVSIHPEHGRTYEELRRNADAAMYRAKVGTKGGAAFFDAAVGKAISARMDLEQRLRLAIRDRQLCCAFQPKVDIRSQEVVGFETLVRWRDSEGEIQSPLEFIGLATELGLIDPITHFVLAEAIGSIDRLDHEFGPGKTIAINVAAKQAGDLRFMRSLVDALAASGCAERFMLELTEDAFLAKSQFQMQVLPMLREIGLRVSIDDFGTGYSSLSVLADITADEIKIDRSFITDIHNRPRSQSVLKAIESVSGALGMSIVAEGVESFEELAYLLDATRIRYAQGYHFAKPFFLQDATKKKAASVNERVIALERHGREGRTTTGARSVTSLHRN
ncbi:MAG TPA: EAL domain-containing protein [Xanthobacteraceae bacterium]